MGKVRYLTSPLYYVNDVPHVGHVYTTVIGDVLARYWKMLGHDVCYLTGTDEHGLKIERAAEARGITPENMTDLNSKAFSEIWEGMSLHFDATIRTTDPQHTRTVQEVFRRIKENGLIYLGEDSGQYSVRDEAYVANDAKVCPECGGETEFIKEESYFFKLSAFQDKLLAFYREHPDFIIPKTRMNEVVSFVMAGLKDISISRTSFSWGIPVPGDEKHIFYVWFDALFGYLSGIDFGSENEKFNESWPATLQLMGKDILRFHGVFWPAFLMAADLEPPNQLLAHGWWTIEGRKMSKSLGNVITAERLQNTVPSDAFRYFFIREISLGADGNFSVEALINRTNNHLANDLGNLSSRILKMIENYFQGEIPATAGLERADKELMNFSKETISLFLENFDKLQLNRALENAWELISLTNRYIVANEPWKLSKDPLARGRLGTVLYNSAETLRILCVLLSPILCDGTRSIFRQLGEKDSPAKVPMDTLGWGGLRPGTTLGNLETVYPRLEYKKISKALKRNTSDPIHSKTEPSPEKTLPTRIGIADFSRVEMRVGKILEAARIKKSDKLLKIQVDIGKEKRQVVAGIGKTYNPEDLIGRLVAVVVNLEPATLMGVESNGMIVAAEDVTEKLSLATFAEPVEVGARLR